MKKMFDKIVRLFRKKDVENHLTDKDEFLLLRKIAAVDRLFESGYLNIDRKGGKRLVVGATVANLFLTEKKKWEAFLQSVWCWIVYAESRDGWRKLMLDAEVDAIRKARKEHASLSKSMEADIRMKARASVDFSSCNPPEVGSFEFVLTSDAIASCDSPEVLSIGKYEDGRFEIVPYEEISIIYGHGEPE